MNLKIKNVKLTFRISLLVKNVDYYNVKYILSCLENFINIISKISSFFSEDVLSLNAGNCLFSNYLNHRLIFSVICTELLNNVNDEEGRDEKSTII